MSAASLQTIWQIHGTWFVSSKATDWLERTSPKWNVLCHVRCKTLPQSVRYNVSSIRGSVTVSQRRPCINSTLCSQQGWIVTKYFYFITVLGYFSEYFYFVTSYKWNVVLLLLLTLLFWSTFLLCKELQTIESTKYLCVQHTEFSNSLLNSIISTILVYSCWLSAGVM